MMERTRILVVLKKGADPGVVEKQLYEYTKLQSTFSVQNIALVNRQPRTLTLRQLLQCYVDHRVEVIRRRTEFLLRQAKQQAHKLEGLILAVCDIDEVIAIIRSSRTREEAIERLQAKAFRIARDHVYAPFVPKRLIDRSQLADGRDGLTDDDREVANLLRKTKKPILLVVNKVDHISMNDNIYEFYELGLGDPIAISAANAASVSSQGEPARSCAVAALKWVAGHQRPSGLCR